MRLLTTKSENHVRGMSLVELLVAIAIISILLALLLPAVQMAREAARSTQCRNNLKQVSLALQFYHDTHAVLPSGGFPHGGYRIGWPVRVLPFLEQQARYDEIGALKEDALMTLEPWRYDNDDGFGRNAVWTQPLTVFACPSSPLGAKSPDITSWMNRNPWVVDQAALHYRANGGSRSKDFVAGPTNRGYTTSGVIYPESKVSLGRFSDGTSNTLLLGETSASTGWPEFQRTAWNGINPWTWGYFHSDEGYLMVDHKYVQYPIGYRGQFPVSGMPFRSAHSGGGAMVAMCDGSVQYMSVSTSLDVLQASATRDGGETVADD